jgi:alpha-mannosidase
MHVTIATYKFIKNTNCYILSFFLLVITLQSIYSQQVRIYIANDDHTDYMWVTDEDGYKNAFIEMLDYYINLANNTTSNQDEYQSRFNCDGSYWIRIYEKNKSQAELNKLINKIKTGHISVPLNTLVSTYGGQPLEAVLRDLYYAGHLERKYNLDFNMAVAMENQTMPYGLGSLWAGSGVKYSWKGVCDCATKVGGLTHRDHEIYRWRGPDDSEIIVKWYSIVNSNTVMNNQGLGGYAEARDPVVTINDAYSKCNTTDYPYHIVGAFGKGWDDIKTLTDEFVNIAIVETKPDKQVIVSNEYDFFQDFENYYSDQLPVQSVSFGNEWDLYCASLTEVSSKVKRSVEKLRTAEAISTFAAFADSMFAKDLDSAKMDAWIGLGLFWEHGWTADGNISKTVRASWQRKIQNQISSYIDTLYNKSVNRLARLIDNPYSNLRFYVFNPLNWIRSDYADIEYDGSHDIHIIDISNSHEVPFQFITYEGSDFLRIYASDIPSIGYKVFEIRNGTGNNFPPAASFSENIIENEFYRITITPSGVITSLIDKMQGNREWVMPINERYLNDLGSGNSTSGALSVINEGPVSMTIKAISSNPIQHTTEMTLFRNSSRINVTNSIIQNFSEVQTWNYSFNLPDAKLWHEEVGAVIKADYVNSGGQYSTNNSRFDWLSLNHFARFDNGINAITLSNADCSFMKLGNSNGNTLDTNATWIQVLAGGQVDGADYGIQNQGGDDYFLQRFALNTQINNDDVHSMKFSLEHQNPLVAHFLASGNAFYHENSYSLLSVEDPNLILWSIKPAEEGISFGFINRFWNLTESPVISNVNYSGLIKSAFNATHVETNLNPASYSGNKLNINFNQKQLKTYRVYLEINSDTTIDEINHSPVIYNQAFSITENPPADTLIGQIIAYDTDSGQMLNYSIISGNINSAFKINSLSGELFVDNPLALNYEQQLSFSLTIMVTDNGTNALSSSAIININLIDINEKPVINDVPDQKISINENFDTIQLDDYVYDPDDPDDQLIWSVSNSDYLFTEINQLRQLIVFPRDLNWSGFEELILIVQDLFGNSDIDTINFIIEKYHTSYNDPDLLFDSIFILPNPSNGSFYFTIRESFNINSIIQIVNIYGQIVYKYLIPKGSGNIFQLNLNLIPGIYFLRAIINQKTTKTIKFIIN